MRRAFLYLLLINSTISLFAQERHSWDGFSISPNAKLRTLNLLVNIIYDVHPEKEVHPDTEFWPKAVHGGINNEALPTPWLKEFIDTEYIPGQMHGTMTRLYGESSFDSLQIVGDFMVVNLPESYILNHHRSKQGTGVFTNRTIARSTLSYINEHGGLNTIYGHNDPRTYDFTGDGSFFFTQILIRNITAEYGGANAGSGWGMSGFTSSDSILAGGQYFAMNSFGTMQCVGSGDIASNPTGIVTHELSHALFGDNDFHTSGGNHRASGCPMSFLNIQGGYGLMGAAESSLVCCNGYERWRMHWKHPNAAAYISAHSIDNQKSIPSDIRKEDGPQHFLLRDFITYGDAIRIQLPYKDSVTSSNQYIWLENHQVGFNQKLDFLQYSNTAACRPIGRAGIYAYYQVGRDVLSGKKKEVWDMQNRDNLRIIPAEGYYDFSKVTDSVQLDCVGYQMIPYALERGAANPFCGNHDQQRHFFPPEDRNNLLTSDEYPMWHKNAGKFQDLSLPSLGDELDAFTQYTQINMGTNPSTCNAIVCHSNNYGNRMTERNSQNDTRCTYLTGLSIEMIPQANHDFLVNIRWDDYHIKNDMRWTGRIVLIDSAILNSGYHLFLEQNPTVIQTTRDEESGYFSPTTRLLCCAGSYLECQAHSGLTLNESSVLELDSTAILKMGTNSSIKLKNGSQLILHSGAKLLMSNNIVISASHSSRIQIEDESLLEGVKVKRKKGIIREIRK